jgi:plastocyanin
MKNSNMALLGLGLAAILVLSIGAVYAMTSRAPAQSASTTYPSSYGTYGGMMGRNGGMMGTWSSNPGGASGVYGGMMGGYGGMMGTSPYSGGASGAYGMMGTYGRMMGGYGYPAWNYTSARPLVVIANYGFHPATITVPVGTTVTWVNMDFVQHTVTAGSEQAPTGLFDSHELSHMQSFSYTFNAPGAYTYYCDIHPEMVGTVVVTG